MVKAFFLGGTMLHIVLYHPEIPPNTGNVARLCAGTGTQLHLIEPLGFVIDDKHLKRAGLDYWPHVNWKVWPSLDAYLAADGVGRRIVATSARGGDAVHCFAFSPQDSLLFGPESSGLPQDVLALAAARVRIPTRNCIRSLNLSTSAGIVLYMALSRVGALEEW